LCLGETTLTVIMNDSVVVVSLSSVHGLQLQLFIYFVRFSRQSQVNALRSLE